KKDFTLSHLKTSKIKGLGIKVEELPKLYYNNFYQLLKDMISSGEFFSSQRSYLKSWYDIKNEFLNKKILYPYIDEHSRKPFYKDIFKKHFSVSNHKYFSFTSDLSLREVPSKSMVNSDE